MAAFLAIAISLAVSAGQLQRTRHEAPPSFDTELYSREEQSVGVIRRTNALLHENARLRRLLGNCQAQPKPPEPNALLRACRMRSDGLRRESVALRQTVTGLRRAVSELELRLAATQAAPKHGARTALALFSQALSESWSSAHTASAAQSHAAPNPWPLLYILHRVSRTASLAVCGVRASVPQLLIMWNAISFHPSPKVHS
jgi:hypothetical protein